MVVYLLHEGKFWSDGIPFPKSATCIFPEKCHFHSFSRKVPNVIFPEKVTNDTFPEKVTNDTFPEKVTIFKKARENANNVKFSNIIY